MSIPVNLYVDRMSPVQPMRVADVYAVTQDRAPAYKEAAAKIGLSPREYAEFRQRLNDGGAIYVRLPRHIDAMAGIHRRNGQVYALRNVVVPSGTMGWEVNLADGTTVIIPRICGNLSMNHGRAIAAAVHKPRTVAMRTTQPHAVRAASYVSGPVAVVPETPVTFDQPQTAAPVAAVPIVAAAGHSALPFLGLLFPGLAASVGGSHHSAQPVTQPASVSAPPCSGGSNLMGVCHE